MNATDLCVGSGQLTMSQDPGRARCPVCRTDVTTIKVEPARWLIVDHKPRRDDAQPLALGLFA